MNITVRTPGKAGKGCGIFFLAFFALAGFGSLIPIGNLVWENVRSYNWEIVPSTILKSDLRTERSNYILDVSFQYQFGGNSYTGTRLKPGGNKVDGTAASSRVAQRYRSDTVVPCRVNPSAPEESYLQRGSLLYA